MLIDIFGPLLLALAAGATLERIAPRRPGRVDRLRWAHAAVLHVIAIALIGVAVAVGQFVGASAAAASGIGVMNALGAPFWLALPVGVLALDFSEWLAHWGMHRSPLLWRAHRVHHSDETLDVSTSLRFHPAETLIRFALSVSLLAAVGGPPEAAVVYAALVLPFNVWEHANVVMPARLRGLSAVFVTPDLHRLHHIDVPSRRYANLGVVLSLWDRAFGTFWREDGLEPSFGLGPGSELPRTLGALLTDPLRPEEQATNSVASRRQLTNS